ncbi:MAG: anthranilate synthase component I, partial [Alphaproteobacteria bacterium]|nr:anthranilate synthase component I [Alphaproteobacteria bacterium]
MKVLPEFEAFAKAYDAGQPQVLWSPLVADLETPVSAFLKLAEGRPNGFLLESVEGGAVRGRYSVIGLKPDLIWRCVDGVAEINRAARYDEGAFEVCDEPPLDSMRALIAETHIDLPEDLPPMAAGLVGYLGYDMVRLMERLPSTNRDTLGVPEALLIRPTIMAIFDAVQDTITVVTPARPEPGMNARAAYAQAAERLADTVADLERSLRMPAESGDADMEALEPVSNTTREEYYEMVEAAKKYILAGDIFQVVPSQRFSTPFRLPPF